MKATFHPEARRDRREAQRYYDAGSPRAGASFDLAIRRAIAELLRYPQMGPTFGPPELGCRRKQLHGFPYGLIYRIDGETIFITAVAADAREPYFWASRVH